jgi:hypothetical protein
MLEDPKKERNGRGVPEPVHRLNCLCPELEVKRVIVGEANQ